MIDADKAVAWLMTASALMVLASAIAGGTDWFAPFYAFAGAFFAWMVVVRRA